ncbi:MAG TPA: helix-turn-helix domain-containing protein [Terriglobia bacterium]|nr:helix-turn-helix domain-containing protein [Terriglobia bacterium]
MKQLAIFESDQIERPERDISTRGSTARRVAESTTRPGGESRGVEALLTSRVAAEVLRIHSKVLERMAKRGEIPALKVGKFWRYHAATLDAWIKSRLESGRQPCRMKTSF